MNDKPAPLMHSARTRGMESRYLMLAGWAGGFSNASPWHSDISIRSFWSFDRLLGSVCQTATHKP